MATEGEQLARLFLAHRTVTQQIAHAIPSDQGDFRPWSGAMAAHDLVRHMAIAHHRFVQRVRGEEPISDAASPTPDLPSAVQLLDRLTDEDTQGLSDLTAAQLEHEVIFRDRPMSARFALTLGREHEVHHKAQLLLYGRMIGAELPTPFRWRAQS